MQGRGATQTTMLGTSGELLDHQWGLASGRLALTTFQASLIHDTSVLMDLAVSNG